MCRIKNKLAHTPGFSLTELLVSVGVLGIVILIASGSSQMILRSASTADKITEQTAMISEIADLLGNPSLCTTALAGKQSIAGRELMLSLQLQSGQKYNNKVLIRSIQLQNIVNIMSTAYRADVVVSGEKLGDVVGSKNFSKTTRVLYLTNSEGRIVSCFGESVDIIANCTVLGGVWDETSTYCNFCQALGGKRNEGHCQLPQVNSEGVVCEPEVFSQTLSSVPPQSISDPCKIWSSAGFNNTLSYINGPLPKMKGVYPQDIDSLNSSFKDFYSDCITGQGLSTSSCSRSSKSGSLVWDFHMTALPANTAPGLQPRCSATLSITLNSCGR